MHPDLVDHKLIGDWQHSITSADQATQEITLTDCFAGLDVNAIVLATNSCQAKLVCDP
jgi:hypothetical protein